MRFQYPLFALLFILLPLVWWLRPRGLRLLYSSFFWLDIQGGKLKAKDKWNPLLILWALRLFTMSLFIFALMRPQLGKTYSEVESEGVDIFIAIDTSNSMQAHDFKDEGKPVDRLVILKKVAKEFVTKRSGDRLGLIVFGQEAFTQCPLTLDHGVMLQYIDQLEIGMAGDATAIGSAIGVGVLRMKELKAKTKIMILLTDGANTAGDVSPAMASDLAKKYDIKIYTVGVGSKGEVPVPVQGFFGTQYQYVKMEIDEQSLTDIANKTSGKYFRATDTEGLEKIYAEIDRLEKREIKVKEFSDYREVFQYFVAAAILLFFLELVLSRTLLRSMP